MFKDKETFIQEYLEKFEEIEGKTIKESSANEQYQVLAILIKEKARRNSLAEYRLLDHSKEKQVYYFSMEFLIGKLLNYYLINLGIRNQVETGLQELGISLADLEQQEYDAGLGNGGLGRLAACYLDSMAFLGIKGHGNGIRYKYGLFQQKIVDGFQAEIPDNWLKNDYPWETRQPDKSIIVKFKGNVESKHVDGKWAFTLENAEPVLAVPYDIPIISYDAPQTVNNLRLWSAEPASEDFDLASFNRGEHSKAVKYKSEVETISYILYPEDSSYAGRELRLKQEYFFVAAGLGAIVRRFKKWNKGFLDFPRKVAIHVNDTHPALCVPELMRILIDEEGMGWEQAWNITVNSISYTNHTIMPEAMEKWNIDLFKNLLPRIYMIVEEIDRRFREEIGRRFPSNQEILEQTAILRHHEVRMANLAIIGSNSVNGVAALHTEILKTSVLKDFYRIYPYKFSNKTNGVSYRRFLLAANPDLSALITEAIGEGWKKNALELEGLLAYREDRNFLQRLAEAKQKNKNRLAAYIRSQKGIQVDPNSVFDIHVKRIHGYKRQLLNILKVIDLYNRIKENPTLLATPQAFIFGGKAAPGYRYAKAVIKLINAVADQINNDPAVEDRMKVVFLENFNVSLAEKIYPAAEISEQISTASREASGTGNMKFMLNGAVTLGTLDGANVEILEAVGPENIFIFGIPSEQVLQYDALGGYDSWDEYHHSARIKRVVDQLISGTFSKDAGEFRIIYDSLLRDNDAFFVLKDFHAYLEAYNKVLALYANRHKWNQTSLINIAKAGIFSSDRSIRQYADGIWKVPVKK